ncbi:MAG TPA: CsbD family protein [Sporosarcina psychrophila]|uniref:CsbD family protein n=1 Tax=Sporosarcina psychrophila TaxID=1476 RepID=A0A921G2E6_SPOPS|nr:CsbD family protein [Sporosarcina psychrophila]
MTNNSFSDKVKGTVNKVKGETKDQIGNATNDASLQAEGKFDKLKGEAQKKVGELKDKFSDTNNR